MDRQERQELLRAARENTVEHFTWETVREVWIGKELGSGSDVMIAGKAGEIGIEIDQRAPDGADFSSVPTQVCPIVTSSRS